MANRNGRWRSGRHLPLLAIHMRVSSLMKPKGSLGRCCPHVANRAGHMAEDVITTTGIARHGAARLPSVEIDSFNIELKDDDGILGDRASKGAFRKLIDHWRKPLR